MNDFIVFEGICCSGKTTTCKRLSEKLTELSYRVVYNHGALTYTELGREFVELTAEKDMVVTTLYYFLDLVINTRKVIRKQLSAPGTVILQDRYYDSITTYIKAYGEYCGRDCDIYRIPEVLIQEGDLVRPPIKFFCIPPFSVIAERLEKSKSTPVHDYYRQHPAFFKMAYDELEELANSSTGANIIDTSSEISIRQGIDIALAFLIEQNAGNGGDFKCEE